MPSRYPLAPPMRKSFTIGQSLVFVHDGKQIWEGVVESANFDTFNSAASIELKCMPIRTPIFTTQADSLVAAMRTTRETIQMQEVRALTTKLVAHLEEIGYLAGSEGPEMMEDAWNRIYRDFQRVQVEEDKREQAKKIASRAINVDTALQLAAAKMRKTGASATVTKEEFNRMMESVGGLSAFDAMNEEVEDDERTA